MPRPTAEHYELSATENRDIIKLIEQGKSLPEKYRFLLCDDKREVELGWNGKSREVCTARKPFQTLEHIGEPRKVGGASSPSSSEGKGQDAPSTSQPGKAGGRLVVVGPINLPVGRLFIEEVITECRKRGASRVDVLAFEFEMGLFPAVLDEAKQKGLDLAPKTIPPEVFDRRAVEKGEVRFHDVAYLEVRPRFDKKNKLALAVELVDFSVYYSQGIAESITAELKAGKSEVVCEAGKLIKIAKDKSGIVARDVLTKKWTGWVDYWAVDFDYENRKEIIKMPKRMGVEGELPGTMTADTGELVDFQERWTGA